MGAAALEGPAPALYTSIMQVLPLPSPLSRQKRRGRLHAESWW